MFVRHPAHFDIQRRPRKRILGIFPKTFGELSTVGRHGSPSFGFWTDLVPARSFAMVFVINFSHAHGSISVLAQPYRHVLCIGVSWLGIFQLVAVDAGRGCVQSSHHRLARRVTLSHLAMSIAEQHALPGQSIQAGSLSVRIATRQPTQSFRSSTVMNKMFGLL